MTESERELIRLYQQVEREILQQEPPAPPEQSPPTTLHHSELTEAGDTNANAREWNHYIRIVGRLLADGHKEKWILIRGESVVGIYESKKEAYQVRHERFPDVPVLIHQIRTYEPLVRIPFRYLPCRS